MKVVRLVDNHGICGVLLVDKYGSNIFQLTFTRPGEEVALGPVGPTVQGQPAMATLLDDLLRALTDIRSQINVPNETSSSQVSP